MEGNKYDALKSLEIGKEAFNGGDGARALKFLNKARRLDPRLDIDNLLSAAAAYNYTEEQMTMVKQIMEKKDYYEILGLTKTCSIEDVRKAYRILSLKVHPDKNKAPRSEEAFKAISKAFRCLTNEESRKIYDLASSSSTTADADSYTEEQIMIVKQIMGEYCYYKILGLEKTYSVEDVQKAYRTLYLKVHPDNNKAPLAEKAFKKVLKAFHSLSNDKKVYNILPKKNYDVGSDEPVDYEKMRASASRGNGGNGNNNNSFYETYCKGTTENFGLGMGDQGGSTGFGHQLFLFLYIALCCFAIFIPFFRQYRA